MSSSARKLIPYESPHSERVFDASEKQLHGIFEHIFRAIRALNSTGELLIAPCSQFDHECRVEIASPLFSHLVNQTLSLSNGPFAELMKTHKPFVLADTAALKASEIAFSKLGEGNGAVFTVGLSEDVLAIMLYWQPESDGALLASRVDALRLLADLAGQAAQNEESKLDSDALQIQMQTLTKELRETQMFYRQFSDAISQCFWVLDVDSAQVVAVSDNFERVWGASRRILGDGLTGFMANVDPADRDRVLSEFHMSLGSELNMEFRLINKNSEVRWIWLRAYPTLDGPVTGDHQHAPSGHRRVVLIADDITEKKLAEESSRAREADIVAQARMNAVGDLASGVAHEINNPLTVIVGKCDQVLRQLEKEAPDLPKVKESIEKIQNTSVRISKIVASLKSLSRKGKTPAARRASLFSIVDDVRDVCAEKFKTAGIDLRIAPLPGGLEAEVDPTLVGQMLLHLLDNAFDAAVNQADKWVSLEATDDDSSIYIYVTDCGPGIPIKSRGRIFDPFFTTKGPGQGTGLGLSLASGIAAHHGGMIRLDTMNAHTRFVVQLPKQQPAREIVN